MVINMVIIKVAACAVVAAATGAATLFGTEEPANASATAAQRQLVETFHPPVIDINRLADAFR
ncbi:MAG TPA: hypothetical protein VF774_19670 [Pseudoduganella sp.]|jgi:hypothetical protein